MVRAHARRRPRNRSIPRAGSESHQDRSLHRICIHSRMPRFAASVLETLCWRCGAVRYDPQTPGHAFAANARSALVREVRTSPKVVFEAGRSGRGPVQNRRGSGHFGLVCRRRDSGRLRVRNWCAGSDRPKAGRPPSLPEPGQERVQRAEFRERMCPEFHPSLKRFPWARAMAHPSAPPRNACHSQL